MATPVELAAERAIAPTSALSPPRRLLSLLSAADIPIKDRRFWLIQTLVAAIAGIHNIIEMFEFVPHLGMLYFVPTALFFMPVVYAAVNFGLRGSIPTAIWCTLLSIPNWVLWHSGLERYGDIAQMAFVAFFAVFVGMRVDEEKRAFAQVAAVSRELELSQLKYRELFESAREGILVLDESGRIIECNAAARMLARDAPFAGMRYRRLDEVFPQEAAALILAQAANPEKKTRAIPLYQVGGNEIWVEPVCTPLADDSPTTQVLLRNVTRQRRHQIGLEMFTAQMHKAQEDERRRIAQEIHDESLQSLVLLCRELDDLEERCNGSSGVLAGDVRDVRDRAEEIGQTLRGIIRGLRPPALDDLGVKPAIERLLADVSARSRIEMRFAVSGQERRASPDLELAILRIGQEAIYNAERHGAPSRIDVHIGFDPGSIEIHVRDDGKGFVASEELSDLAKQGSWGIIGMHERARELGALLHIQSAPGAGTTVTARFRT